MTNSSTIAHVIVDPPIDLTGTAQLGRDFSGTFAGATLRMRFDMFGVDAVKIVFANGSPAAEVCFVFVGVMKN